MTQTFGDIDLAREIHAAYNGNVWGSVPEGWRHLGAGSYRSAYLHLDSMTVYKVGDYEQNIMEAANSRRLRRAHLSLSVEIGIPRTRTFRVKSTEYRYGRAIPECVVAQEYVIGDFAIACDSMYDSGFPCSCESDPCHGRIMEEIEQNTGISDIHSENVLIDLDERWWIIDIAM